MRLLFLLALMFCPTNALNVLVYSVTIGHSHVNFMGSIADTLVRDGHNVTLLIVENDPDVQSTGSQLVQHVIRFSSPFVGENEWADLNFKKGDVFSMKTFHMSDYFHMQDINYRVCKGLMLSSELLARLRESHFDIAIMELFDFCPAGIFQLINVPKIVLASALGVTLPHQQLLGIEQPNSYVPAFMTHSGARMHFVDRVYNLLFHYTSKLLYAFIYYKEQALFNTVHPQIGDLYKSYKEKVDYVLLNSNEFTESTRPTLRSLISIGGATTNRPQPLQQEWENLVSSRKGAVLFSLGSLVKSEEMPSNIKKAFLSAFREFPDYTFIWKDDRASNFSLPNVYYRPWVPQVDLLADGRVKAFITHGGMNSIQEAQLFGVPLIVMPCFADQEQNAAIAEERGMAIALDKFRLTKESVVAALKAVLDDDQGPSSYRSRARMASRVLSGKISQGKEMISRVVRISASEKDLTHLRVPTDHLYWFQYHSLDVLFCLASVFIAASYVVLRLFSYIQGMVSIGRNKKKVH